MSKPMINKNNKPLQEDWNKYNNKKILKVLNNEIKYYEETLNYIETKTQENIEVYQRMEKKDYYDNVIESIKLGIEKGQHRYKASLNMLCLFKNYYESMSNPKNEKIVVYEVNEDNTAIVKKMKTKLNVMTGELEKTDKFYLVKNNKKQTMKSLIGYYYLLNKFLNQDKILSSQLNLIPQFNGIVPYSLIKYNSVYNAKTNKFFSYDREVQNRYISVLEEFKKLPSYTLSSTKEDNNIIEENISNQIENDNDNNNDFNFDTIEEKIYDYNINDNFFMENYNSENDFNFDTIEENSINCDKNELNDIMEDYYKSRYKNKNNNDDKFKQDEKKIKKIINNSLIFEEKMKLNEVIEELKTVRLLKRDRDEIGNILYEKNQDIYEKVNQIYNYLFNNGIVKEKFEQNVSLIYGVINETSKGYLFKKEEDKTQSWDKLGIKYKKIKILDKKYSEYFFSPIYHKEGRLDKNISDFIKGVGKINYNNIVNVFIERIKEPILTENYVEYSSMKMEELYDNHIYRYISGEKIADTQLDFKTKKFIKIYTEEKNDKIFKWFMKENELLVPYSIIGDNSKKDIKQDEGRIYHAFTKMSKYERVVILKDFHEYDIDNGMGSFFRSKLKKHNYSSYQHNLFFYFKKEVRKKILDKLNENLIYYAQYNMSQVKQMIASCYYGTVNPVLRNLSTIIINNKYKFNFINFLDEINTVQFKIFKLINCKEKIDDQNYIFVKYTRWEKKQIEKFLKNNNILSHKYVRIHDAILTPKTCTWKGDEEVRFGFTSWNSMYKELEEKAKIYTTNFEPLYEEYSELYVDVIKSKCILGRKNLKETTKLKWEEKLEEALIPVKEFYEQHDFSFDFETYYQKFIH